MVSEFPLKSIAEERGSRLLSRAHGGADESQKFWETITRLQNGADVSHIKSAYDYAFTLDYHHPGLSAKAYLAHPVRVAHLAAQLINPLDPELVAIALLHNTLEVSSVSRAELAARFGEKLTQTLANLTVDRLKHDQPSEKRAYYARLQTGGREGCIIKILDKLDNLFLLCLNSNDRVRSEYLAEIEEFLIPMTQSHLPVLVAYLKELIQNARELGFMATAETI